MNECRVPSFSSFCHCPRKSSLTLPFVHPCNDLYLSPNSFNIFELVQLRSRPCEFLPYKRWGAVNRQDMRCFNGDDTGTRWYKYIQVHTSTSCFDSVNCAFFWGGRLKTCTIFCVFVPAFGKHFTELVCSTDRSRLRCHGFPGISCFLDHSLNDSKRKVPFAKRILYCLGMVG